MPPFGKEILVHIGNNDAIIDRIFGLSIPKQWTISILE
jgi:hypothetical protein